MLQSVAIFSIIVLASCSSLPDKEDSLYSALGSEAGVKRLAIKAVELTHNDERIAFLFEESDMVGLLHHLEDQLCFLSGGPCEYKGREMIETHSGLDISEAEFDIFVELFIDVMEQVGISHSARNRLLAILAPMRQDIIHQ